MSKIRVYELSKKLNINSKDLMEKLKEFGIETNSHMSTLEDSDAALIEEFYKLPQEEKKEEEKEILPEKEQNKAQPKKEKKGKSAKQEKAEVKKAEAKEGNKQTPSPKPEPEPEPKTIEPAQEDEDLQIKYIEESITVKELAELIGKNGTELVKILMKKGMMYGINQSLDFDTASAIAEDFDLILEKKPEKDIFEETFKDEPDDEKNLQERPPVVVVMGSRGSW